jgi:3-isopropylmalate dehydrogenase
MSEYNIAVVSGDGIGPEIIAEAVKVLNVIGSKYKHKFNYTSVLAGGIAIDKTGECLPAETIKICKESDAVLLGAVGGPKWDNVPTDSRPERALLGLRKELNLFANLRPAKMFDCLADACPLKPEIIKGGLDIMIVRELTGGIYFGDHGIEENESNKVAFDVERYSEFEIRRILKKAYTIARKRNKKLCVVDKANVLETSRLWRSVNEELAKDYTDIDVSYMYVDNAAMQLIRNPRQFDVIVTSNMFGDILSDEASMITGSIGLLPSASLNDSNFGMYEPIHGSAPDIAGKNISNPIATILSVAMMLRHSFNLEIEALAIENAVTNVLEKGYHTIDITSNNKNFLLSTTEMGDAIVKKL